MTDLESKLEQRVIAMLEMATVAKDLIQAVKAATAYLAVKKEIAGQGGFGEGFKDE